MTILGQTHLVTAIAAIVSGAATLWLSPKGSALHRRLGWTYATSMLAVNATALMIYRLFGGFGPFHVAAIISLVGLLLGVREGRRAAIARRAKMPAQREAAVERHYYWMTWSYVGLLAAFASELMTRLPALRPMFGGGRMFALGVGVATLLVVGIGSRWIKRAAAATLGPFRRPAGAPASQ